MIVSFWSILLVSLSVPSMDLYEHSDYNRVYSLAESSFFSGICMPK